MRNGNCGAGRWNIQDAISAADIKLTKWNLAEKPIIGGLLFTRFSRSALFKADLQLTVYDTEHRARQEIKKLSHFVRSSIVIFKRLHGSKVVCKTKK